MSSRSFMGERYRPLYMPSSAGDSHPLTPLCKGVQFSIIFITLLKPDLRKPQFQNRAPRSMYLVEGSIGSFSGKQSGVCRDAAWFARLSEFRRKIFSCRTVFLFISCTYYVNKVKTLISIILQWNIMTNT
jgi:hypothetical protein